MTGFSHAHLPDGVHTTLLSQGCILGAAASVGRASAMHNPRMGSWWGASDGPGPANRSTSSHVLSTTSSNMVRPVDSTCELILHFHRFKVTPAAKRQCHAELQQRTRRLQGHRECCWQMHCRQGSKKVAPGVCLFLAGPTTASSVMEEPARHIKVSALASAVGSSGTEKWEKPGSLGERRSCC